MAAPADLIRKIRRIEITTRRAVQDILAGGYHSVFKGRGMAFSEVRPYQPGDEIRSIDWNVTARMGEPFVKVFAEERELTALIAVDRSASQDTGLAPHANAVMPAEIAARLAFSAQAEVRNRGRWYPETCGKREPAAPGKRAPPSACRSASGSSAGSRWKRSASAPATTTSHRSPRSSVPAPAGGRHDRRAGGRGRPDAFGGISSRARRAGGSPRGHTWGAHRPARRPRARRARRVWSAPTRHRAP